MMESWIGRLKSAVKTTSCKCGLWKIHYTFEDGSEMIEEYAEGTCQLRSRKLRSKSMIGKEGNWEIEVGSEMGFRNIETEGFLEDRRNPCYSRLDTRDAFQWMVTNIPYPIETYNIEVQPEENTIIIKTSNKKYYKKFSIPDLIRLNLKLEQSRLTFTHVHDTLIIKYKKPKEILDLETQIMQEIKKIEKKDEGDVGMCCPS